jgi:integrase
MRAKVLAAAQDDTIMKPIVTTLLFTGLRSGELLALTWDDVDFDTRRITVHTAVTTEGKRTVVSEQTAIALRKVYEGMTARN